MYRYGNIKMEFTKSEEGHNPITITAKGFDWKDGVAVETGNRLVMSVCSNCRTPLILYANYNSYIMAM